MDALTPHDVENFFHAFDDHAPIIYSNTQEEYQAHEYLTEIVEDLASGHTVQDSEAFWDLLDYLGMEYADFPWEDFREWYDSVS
jgi:hypothetical protein